MAEGSSKPRRLTVFAEVAAVLALVVAIVGMIVAVLAYEHDKEVAPTGAVATPVATVTQFTRDTQGSPPEQPDSQSLLGDIAVILVVGAVAAWLLYMIWTQWMPFSVYFVLGLSATILAMVIVVAWVMTGSVQWALICGGAVVGVSLISIARLYSS